MKISVAVRQKFHGFHLANELDKNDKLNKLFTSYYGSFNGKDNSKGYTISKSRIKTNLLSTFFTYGIKDQSSLYYDNYFGNWVTRNLTDEDIVITWGLYALPIIKRCKELGIKVALERGSSHVSFQKEILINEFNQLNISVKSLEESFSAKRMDRELLEYELCDIISIPSGFVRNTFLKNDVPNEKLFVNSYGANLKNFFPLNLKHEPFRIIYVGSLSVRKGVLYLLAAFNELNLPHAELWLVGKVYDELKDHLSKFVTSKIKFISPVPQKDLNLLYNQCDVFVISSIEEGMAMVQMEAMASGLPLICTSNSGGEDLIDDGIDGFVIPIKSTKDLKERLLFMYQNREMTASMGINAAAKISNGNTWHDYGKRAINFYHNFLDKAGK